MLEAAGPDRPDAVVEGRDVDHSGPPVTPAAGAPVPQGGPRAAGGPGAVGLLRAAARPRMLVLLVLLLGAAAVCARLGVWQLDRAEIRGASAAAERLAELEAAPPVPIDDVLEPQTTFRGELVGRRVVVSGQFEPAGQLLVEGRAHEGRTGYLVLTPLRVPVGTGGAGGTADAGGTDGARGAVLPVVRGWVATPDDALALAVPDGVVTVTGYLQASEGAGDGGLASGRTDAISSADLVNAWGGPIWSGYVVLTGSDPEPSGVLALLPPPTRAGSGLNIQNLAYAAQWWIFGGFALLLWVRLVRDEASPDEDGFDEETSAPVADGS